MAIIEPEFTLLQMQVKEVGPDAPSFGQPRLCGSPKTLNAVNVNAGPEREHIVGVTNAMMFAVPDIHQPIIAPPAVRMDDATACDLAAQNGLQGALFRIGDDLRVDLAVAFEDAEHDRFAARPPAPFPLHAAWPEVRFIDLHGPAQRSFLFTGSGDPLPEGHEVPIDRVPVEAGQHRYFRSLQIQGEEADEGPKLARRNMGTMHVSILPRHDSVV